MVDVWNYAPLLGLPFYLVALLYAAKFARDTMVQWPNFMAQWNERQRDKAGDKDGLLDRYERRFSALEESEKLCQIALAEIRDELATERAERMKLQAIMDGQGEVRQAAANAAAEVRLDAIDRKAKDDNNGR